ncbi:MULTISPECIES: single-stranded DNA-binding protein [Nocardia]|uniref:single-stranded DNA-binding protein n=1 Tax=Nocardia TaxID=1817 RepID=UPI000D697B39|nr:MULTISPECIES: single-stranded DNA-binding protein [Nocardia]
MAGDTIITVTGNLTSDPELRFTPNGVAVADFTVASTPRYFDRNTNEWKDAEALFLRCNIWRDAAENVAESLPRGARVIVTGRLKQRRWKTDDGQNRTTTELEVDEVGPSLKYATTTINRVPRNPDPGGNSNNGRSAGRPAAQERSGDLVGAGVGAGPGSEDPWAFTGSGSFGGSGEPPSF